MPDSPHKLAKEQIFSVDYDYDAAKKASRKVVTTTVGSYIYHNHDGRWFLTRKLPLAPAAPSSPAV